MPDGTMVRAIAEIAQQAQEAGNKTTMVNGVVYSTAKLRDLRKPEPEPKTLTLRTLSGLAAYVEANRDGLELTELAVVVNSPIEVLLVSKLNGYFQQRSCLAAAITSPAATAGFVFGRYMDRESFNVALQALFVDSDDRPKVLKVIGSVTSENKTTTKDDGMTQSVTVKAGISLVDRSDVPNPVLLRPYRTFTEVDQPSSLFVLRVREERGALEAALMEADGGAWKLEAVQNIKEYLTGLLPDSLVVFA